MTSTIPRTFDSILPAVLSQVPHELIGSESRARVEAVASRLPAILASSTFGFECPLGNESPEADFLVSISGANGAALLSETAAYAAENDAAPVWSSITALAEVWTNKRSIENVWLEFDLTGENPFVPNVFFQPVYSANNHDELRATVAEVGPALLGSPISEQLATSLQRCVNALPERARVFQIGAMRARPTYGLRLCVDEIYLDRILFYLGQIGYPGDLDFVRKTFIALQRLTDAYALHLDLLPDIDVRIGLECYLNPRAAEARQRMEQLLNFLISAGACSTSKAFGIAQYPGATDIRQYSAQWPAALRSMSSFLGRLSTFQRRLHHIKITFGATKSLEAKAYLAVNHLWQ